MNLLCIIGQHKKKLVHTRDSKIGEYQWFECENCDKKLFTVDYNVWGNDKWKNSWHKTPEEDKNMYDENGEIKPEGVKAYYEKNWKNKK